MAAGFVGTIITLKNRFAGLLAMLVARTNYTLQQRKTLRSIKKIEQDWFGYFGIKEWE